MAGWILRLVRAYEPLIGLFAKKRISGPVINDKTTAQVFA
ncbi:hypothetical protein NY78_1800 [Desulfovibrio sp. TomC]|nr:hypothetical protein NY78_1800 [Desulfovibrio sp. TomC]